MGKVVTPEFRVEYWTNDGRHVKTMIWNVRSRANVTGQGKPTKDNLQKWRQVYNESFYKGVNKHFSDAAGFIVRVGRCRIVNQFSGQVVAEYVPPMFEVV